jgi:hypothetical protein
VAGVPVAADANVRAALPPMPKLVTGVVTCCWVKGIDVVWWESEKLMEAGSSVFA